MDESQIEAMLVALASRQQLVEKDSSGKWRLREPIEWLDAGKIRACCGTLGPRVEVLDEADSTQDEIDRFLNLPDHPPLVAVVAEHQRSGRGRQGRAWNGAIGCDILMSAMIPLDVSLAACAGASLAAGVAVRDAFPQAMLKWPNDIVSADGAKIGGILCEAKVSGGGVRLKAGIGINVCNPPGVRRGAVAASSLADIGFRGGRNEACGKIICALARRMRQFSREGFAGLREDWRAGARARPGSWVRFRDDRGRMETAVYRDVGPQGELVVEVAGELRRIYGTQVDEADALH